MEVNQIDSAFYKQDVLVVAPQLLGKIIRLKTIGSNRYFVITETEAYRGEEDLACHCSKGRTQRTEIMYHSGGVFYVYLIYGMYWMLNIVTGKTNYPQAVLIRGIKEVDFETFSLLQKFDGPGKVGKVLGIQKEFYGLPVQGNAFLEILDIHLSEIPLEIKTASRVGIDYAGEVWKNKPWRFILS